MLTKQDLNAIKGIVQTEVYSGLEPVRKDIKKLNSVVVGKVMISMLTGKTDDAHPDKILDECILMLENKDLYPTPEHLVAKMLSKVDFRNKQVKNILEHEKYQLKEILKPIWYALMTLMQVEYPNEIKMMGSELQESVNDILKSIEDLKEKYKRV